MNKPEIEVIESMKFFELGLTSIQKVWMMIRKIYMQMITDIKRGITIKIQRMEMDCSSFRMVRVKLSIRPAQIKDLKEWI